MSGDFECPDEILCSEDEIYELLKSLDVNKANGPDGISARMLKSTANAITPSLTKLLNCSIAHGRPPNSWKTALVVPIPKIPRAKNTSDFRPISLLSILSKVLEYHFRFLITDHLLNYYLCPIPNGDFSLENRLFLLYCIQYMNGFNI